MTYNIIATGSSGNAVILDDRILIDCGVPYKMLRPYAKDLRLVLLTHEHGDHFKAGTVRALHRERPALRWGCCEWMVKHLLDAGIDKRVIDVYVPTCSAVYHWIGDLMVIPVPVFHNVPNCGYKLALGGEKIFYATDTGSLDGIEVPYYDLYLIEANHTQAEIEERIREKEAAGDFIYETAAMQNHLSREQALEWLAQNMGRNSKYVFLHQHRERGADGNGMVRSASDDGEASENAYACTAVKD